MGWAYCGQDDRGREIGYAITATYDKKGCDNVIDRGLGYLCGSMHGGDGGCGRYFCELHAGGPCNHRFQGAYGATMCQPMRSDDGKVWCACGFNHYVEWPAEPTCEKCNGTGARHVAGEPTQELCGECSGEGVVS